MQAYKDWGVLKDNEAEMLTEYTKKLEILESKLAQSKEEANQTKNSLLKLTKQKVNVSNIKELQSGIKEINKNIESFRKRLTNLLVSAFVFNVLSKGLSQFKSTMFSLLKTNDQFASNLNQIKANLMMAFAPIYNACLPAINTLMNALSKLTGTIAVFVASLFGKSLSDAKNEAKGLSKQLGNVKKNGDKASGSLSQIDKLNVLPDSSGTNDVSSGGIESINYNGDIQTSSKLLELLNNIKNFVIENKDFILGFLGGVVTSLLAIKLGCSGILSLGIGLLVGGLIISIKSLIDFLNDPTFENFTNIIIGIGIAIMGLGLIIGNIPLVVAGAIALIVGLIVKNYDKIIGLFNSFISWLETNFKDKMIQLFGPLGGFIADVIIVAVKTAKTAFEGLFGGIKKIVNGIVLLFKGDFKNGIKQVFDGLKSIAFAPLNAIITGLNELIKGINKIKFDVPDWVPGIGGKTLGFNIPQLPHLAKGTVIPPRQEFAAILGDQKHGTNIEAPLETIKQANREVLTEFFDKIGSLSSKVQEIILKNLTFVIQLGGKDFRKAVFEAIRLTEKETGMRLFVN